MLSDSSATRAAATQPKPRGLATHTPTSTAAIDDRDSNAGGASHHYVVQFGGPDHTLHVQFQHGPRGEAGSTPGVFDDDLLAIVEDRLRCFQDGPFACTENQNALEAVIQARTMLAQRAAWRMLRGVLGRNVE